MSYDLGVFYTERPLTDEQAGERYTAYCEEQDLGPFIEPSPRVAAFVRELTDDYPQIDDVPEEDLEACPWSIAFDISEGHVLMSMTYFWAPDMSDVITGLADKHGLVCFNPQSGKILTAPIELLGEREARRIAEQRAPKKAAPPRSSLAAIVSEISARLAELGFAPRGKDAFTWEINDQVVAYIELNGRESRAQTELEPAIGLRHHQLTDFVRKFDKSKVYTAIPLTYSTYLRSVTPSGRSITPKGHIGRWRFGDGEGENVVRDIVAELETHALPFFKAHDTLEAIVQELLARFQGDYETAAGLYLLDRFDDALMYLEANLTENVGDDQPYCRKYRKFARDLIENMKESDWSIDPERRAVLEMLTATPQRATSKKYLREQPFVALLDELLVPRGFGRSGLMWRRNGRHALIAVTLEPGMVDRIWINVDWKVFKPMKTAAPDYDPVGHAPFMLVLEDFCTEPMAQRLRRTLCFYHDFAKSGVLERQRSLKGSLTCEQKRQAIQAMEPEAPLTMDWRLGTLRTAITEHALPLFERIESSALARLRLYVLLVINGYDLGKREGTTVRSLRVSGKA